METLFDTKKYIKKLDLIQLKVLIFLCLKESDYKNFNQHLNGIRDLRTINNYLSISYPKKDTWDNSLPTYVIARIEYHKNKRMPNYLLFVIDDFNIRIMNEFYSESHDSILHKFLISQFGLEYKDYLYENYISTLPNKIDEELFSNYKPKKKKKIKTIK